MNIITVIPSRLSSSRLPNKALADIHGEPMIVHVWRRGVEADLGPVIVACGDREIADAVMQVGGKVVMTSPELSSGSDRVSAAVGKIDPDQKFDVVINLQGDMPTVSASALRVLLQPMRLPGAEISTLASIISDPDELSSENVVKVCASIAEGSRAGRGIYFSRNPIPWGTGDHLHHIGLYAYKRSALLAYSKLKVGVLEQRERLEQLRALENGMRIDVCIVDINPLGVDTFQDLVSARILLDPGRRLVGD